MTKEEKTPPSLSVRIVRPDEYAGLADDVLALYREAGWAEPSDSAGIILKALRNSYRIAGAFTPSGRLAGMMRALSDGVGDAYLLDMVVSKEFRGNGVASHILSVLTGSLKSEGISWIVCVSVPEAETLYLRQGEEMKGHTPVRFR